MESSDMTNVETAMILKNETIIFLSITVNLQTWDNAMHMNADCNIKYNGYLI